MLPSQYISCVTPTSAAAAAWRQFRHGWQGGQQPGGSLLEELHVMRRRLHSNFMVQCGSKTHVQQLDGHMCHHRETEDANKQHSSVIPSYPFVNQTHTSGSSKVGTDAKIPVALPSLIKPPSPPSAVQPHYSATKQLPQSASGSYNLALTSKRRWSKGSPTCMHAWKNRCTGKQTA